MRRRSEITGTPIVEISGVSFGYTPETPVLRMDRFSVEAGSVTAVIGHNGCGKTTLFKVINGLLGPYTGTVRFQGEEISTPGGRERMRRGSIYVHQKPYVFRERVRDNVLYALKVRNVPAEERERRVEKSLRAVGMSHLASRHAHALSGGERQRLALARALALEPELILMDEPTSNIDPESVRLIENAIQEARSRGTTLLLSTHNLATAYRIADIVIPMEAGTVTRDRNNVYRGAVVETGDSLAHFEVDGSRIVVPAQEGRFSAAVVPMNDVILSREEIVSSAQNHFSGPVTEVAPQGELLRVRIDCPFPLDALVTGAARDQLGIEVGQKLHAGFKASSVRLY